MKTTDEEARRQTLEAQLEKFGAEGDHGKCLKSLKDLAELCPNDAEIHHRLGSVEEQVGTHERALSAHLRSACLAPHNPLTYLYAGYCLQQMGRLEEAVSVWSLGSDIERAFLNPPQRSDPTGLRMVAAAKALRHHFSELHRQTLGSKDSTRRVLEAIWPQTADRPFTYQHKQQRPSLFYLPSLPAYPWHNLQNTPWVESLETQSEAIHREFSSAQEALLNLGRPYLGAGMNLGNQFAHLQGSLNWTALDLYRDGELQTEVAKHFPLTLSLLHEAPLYGMDEHPFEVFFSVLKPGQHIKPHFGLSNHSLTVHMPLIIPPACSISVNGERRSWSDGQILVFDDSFIHEAINSSQEARVVLIFSIWNPHLQADERLAIQRSFAVRSRWLAARRLPVC
ncbi:MAG: aspartyl/asparaginyl beta-hydroxylase domain-containing protein [Halioglobus sp.]